MVRNCKSNVELFVCGRLRGLVIYFERIANVNNSLIEISKET